MVRVSRSDASQQGAWAPLFCVAGPQSSFCCLLSSILVLSFQALIAGSNQPPSCSQGSSHSLHGSSSSSLLLGALCAPCPPPSPCFPSHFQAVGCSGLCQCWIRLNMSPTFFIMESAFLPRSLPGHCPAGYFRTYASWPRAQPCQGGYSQLKTADIVCQCLSPN